MYVDFHCTTPPSNLLKEDGVSQNSRRVCILLALSSASHSTPSPSVVFAHSQFPKFPLIAIPALFNDHTHAFIQSVFSLFYAVLSVVHRPPIHQPPFHLYRLPIPHSPLPSLFPDSFTFTTPSGNRLDTLRQTFYSSYRHHPLHPASFSSPFPVDVVVVTTTPLI
jgi:hypothetical protein